MIIFQFTVVYYTQGIYSTYKFKKKRLLDEKCSRLLKKSNLYLGRVLIGGWVKTCEIIKIL